LVVVPLDRGVLGGKGIQLGLDLKGGTHLVYRADFSAIEPGTEAEALTGAIAVIEKRVNALGVSEPVIQRLGDDRIVVELAGVSDVEKAKNLIGQTALLEFGELTSEGEEAKWSNELGDWKPVTAVVDGEEIELSSRYFKENTYVSQDSYGQVVLAFEWDETGSQMFEEITERLLNQPLGIFLGDEPLRGEEGLPIAPYIRSVISDRGIIEGLSLTEATELTRLLNAGRIPVPLTTIYEQTVSPVLGSDFVDMSLKAGIIGLLLVIAFMMVYYRFPGALASAALMFYVFVVLAIFKNPPPPLPPVTLTLAGIGGFVLSIGMAVDANVLIFERLKEELRLGRTPGAAIESGFKRAWPAIRDSNITTFIVCGILYWLGSSIIASTPVMGFAITLAIGVAVSMFSAVVVTRTFLRVFAHSRLAQKTRLFSIYSGREND
ncbi:MAG: protein translocase subunit SecD, partial [Dehalococcoidales bacterium]|nr:protein translocase subunit SecD [Dehalococcoidales bacterium]